MKLRVFIRAARGVSLLLFAGMCWAQFPDLPGRDLTLKVCGNCHEADRAASLRQDKDGWAGTISSMQTQGSFPELSDDEYNALLTYLSKAFPPDPPKPFNINTASAIEMESALALLHSQAVLIVAYRDKNGKFQSLEDLKKVPGLDFAKIEAKKDRISF